MQDVQSEGRADFEIADRIRVRLIGADDADLKAVGAQLGVGPTSVRGEAAIEIVYSDEAPPADGWMLGPTAGRDRRGHYVRGTPGPAVGATWFDISASKMVMRRRPGSGKVPLLMQSVVRAAEWAGLVPVHGTGFTWRGEGILVVGWAKGGKTEALLPFMENGASYVGDEWMLVDPDTREMFGIHEPIRIWDWHLDDLPATRQRLTPADRRRLLGTRWAETAVRRIASSSMPMSSEWRRMADLVHRQRWVQVVPERMWGSGRCVAKAKLEHLVLVVSTLEREVSTSPTTSDLIAAHMAFSNQYERRPFDDMLVAMGFGDPGAVTHERQTDAETQRAHLERAFDGTPSLILTHPYPAPTGSMFSSLTEALG